MASTGAYGLTGTASANSEATGVRGSDSQTLITSANAPAVTGSTGYTTSASSDAEVGGLLFNGFGGTVRSGQATSQGVVIPTQSVNNTNAAFNTLTSLGNATGTFTEVGQGYIGAEATNATGSYTYNTSAEYQLSAGLIGNGKDLLIGSTSAGSTQIGNGSGFVSLTLSIIDNGTTEVFQTFTSYSSFASYVATATELQTASGSQDIVIAISETLSNSNGASWFYALALANSGSTGGSFRTLEAVQAVPLPSGWVMMLGGLPLLWGGVRRWATSI